MPTLHLHTQPPNRRIVCTCLRHIGGQAGQHPNLQLVDVGGVILSGKGGRGVGMGPVRAAC